MRDLDTIIVGLLEEDIDPEEVEKVAQAPLLGWAIVFMFKGVWWAVDSEGRAVTKDGKYSLQILGGSFFCYQVERTVDWKQIRTWLDRGANVSGKFTVRYDRGFEDTDYGEAFKSKIREDFDPEEVEQVASTPKNWSMLNLAQSIERLKQNLKVGDEILIRTPILLSATQTVRVEGFYLWEDWRGAHGVERLGRFINVSHNPTSATHVGLKVRGYPEPMYFTWEQIREAIYIAATGGPPLRESIDPEEAETLVQSAHSTKYDIDPDVEWNLRVGPLYKRLRYQAWQKDSKLFKPSIWLGTVDYVHGEQPIWLPIKIATTWGARSVLSPEGGFTDWVAACEWMSHIHSKYMKEDFDPEEIEAVAGVRRPKVQVRKVLGDEFSYKLFVEYENTFIHIATYDYAVLDDNYALTWLSRFDIPGFNKAFLKTIHPRTPEELKKLASSAFVFESEMDPEEIERVAMAAGGWTFQVGDDVLIDTAKGTKTGWISQLDPEGGTEIVQVHVIGSGPQWLYVKHFNVRHKLKESEIDPEEVEQVARHDFDLEDVLVSMGWKSMGNTINNRGYQTIYTSWFVNPELTAELGGIQITAYTLRPSRGYEHGYTPRCTVLATGIKPDQFSREHTDPVELREYLLDLIALAKRTPMPSRKPPGFQEFNNKWFVESRTVSTLETSTTAEEVAASLLDEDMYGTKGELVTRLHQVRGPDVVGRYPAVVSKNTIPHEEPYRLTWWVKEKANHVPLEKVDADRLLKGLMPDNVYLELTRHFGVNDVRFEVVKDEGV